MSLLLSTLTNTSNIASQTNSSALVPKILVSLEKDPAQCLRSSGKIRRAAFDFGGGTTRVLVADIDLKTKKVEKLYNAMITIDYLGDLFKNSNSFSEEIKTVALECLNELQVAVAAYDPQEYSGAATEAFRLAQNGQQFLDTLSRETKIPVKIVSQEEEGNLGFMSAVTYCNYDPKDTVVVDFGSGSIQVSVLNHDDSFSTFGMKLGSSVINDMIAKQMRGLEKTPGELNPVTKEEAKKVIDHISKELDAMPKELKEIIKSKGKHMTSCRVFPKAGHRLTRENALELLDNIHGRDTYGQKASVASGLFCYTFVSKFAINELLLSGSNNEGNTPGILALDKFWNSTLN